MIRKRRLFSAVIVIVLIAIGGEILIESIAADGLLRFVESRLSAETDLEVRFGDDFHLEILPVLRFEANSVTVTDPQRPSIPLLKIGTLLLEIDPLNLLVGDIVIDELELIDSELTLDSSAASDDQLASDLEALSEPEPGEPSGEGQFFQIRQLGAENFRIVFRAGTAEPSASLVIDALALDARDFDEPVSVMIRGSFEQNQFEVTGEVGAFPQLSNPATPYPISLRVQIGEAEVELAGSIADPLAMHGVELDARLSADDLKFLEMFVEFPFAAIGPVTATTTLRGNLDALRSEKIALRVGEREKFWLEMDGVIGDLVAFKQVHLVAEFGVTELRHIRSLVDRDLPDVGPIRGEITLSDRDDTLGIEMLRVRGGREGTLEVDFTGAIDDLIENDEIEVDIKIDARHLGVIGELFGVDLPPIGPDSFSGQLTGDDEKITASGRTRLDETVFQGEASGSFAPGSRPKLRVHFRSDHVRLEDVGIEPRSDRSEAERVRDKNDAGWWSGDAPLPFFQELLTLDADITLQADRVTGRSGFELKRLRLEAHLDDGNLEISAVAEGHQSGALQLEARVDAKAATPNLSLKASVDYVDLATLTAQLKTDSESMGRLDVLVDLESRGSTPTEIRSNLAGSFRFLIKDAALATRYGSSFVKNVAKLSLPSLVTSRSPQFGCIVAELQIANGVATVVNLVLDSAKAHVTGSGTIDVGADSFDLRLRPKAKKPGILNVAAEVDVSGPLSAPVFKPRLRTVPGNVVRGLLSNVLAPGAALIQPFRSPAEADALCTQGLPIEPHG